LGAIKPAPEAVACRACTGIDFERLAGLMGYNARNDEIHENLERMRRERARTRLPSSDRQVE